MLSDKALLYVNFLCDLQGVMSAKFSEVEATIRVMSSSLQAAVTAVELTGTVKVGYSSKFGLFYLL